jgi:hypothetical protein
LSGDLKVPQIKPRPVRLRGQILGLGPLESGSGCQDDSGILFVPYRQSIPFARLLFATAVASSYTN